MSGERVVLRIPQQQADDVLAEADAIQKKILSQLASRWEDGAYINTPWHILKVFKMVFPDGYVICNNKEYLLPPKTGDKQVIDMIEYNEFLECLGDRDHAMNVLVEWMCDGRTYTMSMMQMGSSLIRDFNQFTFPIIEERRAQNKAKRDAQAQTSARNRLRQTQATRVASTEKAQSRANDWFHAKNGPLPRSQDIAAHDVAKWSQSDMQAANANASSHDQTPEVQAGGKGRRRTGKAKKAAKKPAASAAKAPAKPKATKSKVAYKGVPHTVYTKAGKRYVKVFSKAQGSYRYVAI